jgi:hypothetical protein
MTRDELYSTLYTIVTNVTGVPNCIPADSNHQAPSGEYAAVEPFRSISRRYQGVTTRSTDTTETYEKDVIVESVINFYRGDDPYSRASSLIDCGWRSDVVWPLFKLDIEWSRESAVNNLNALQASQIEKRANISVFLKIKEITTIQLNSILHAPFSIEYEDGTTIVTGD